MFDLGGSFFIIVIHNTVFEKVSELTGHKQGLHQFLLYKKLVREYFDTFHLWKNWWEFMWLAELSHSKQQQAVDIVEVIKVPGRASRCKSAVG
jgi:hypothetical protein